MGFNQTHSNVLETLQTCLRSNPLNKNVCTQRDNANQPLQIVQIQYFPKHFWGRPSSSAGMTHAFQSLIFRASASLNQPSAWLLSRISSFSAPLRFVWLKINPTEPLLGGGRWAPCASTAERAGGLHTEPGKEHGSAQTGVSCQQRSLRAGPLRPSACDFRCFQGWGVGQLWAGCCSLVQELSNGWGRSISRTVQ